MTGPSTIDHSEVDQATIDHSQRDSSRLAAVGAMAAVMAVFFVYAGDPPPGVNEAHYLVKAKNFWQPSFLADDLFASSGKAHWMFYALWGWPTMLVSLESTAWIGRLAAWLILAAGLVRLTSVATGRAHLSAAVAMIWIAAIQFGNLAGEWVVGGIEAKVPAYGLVLFGLADVARDRLSRAWIWMGAAAGLHVLTGGWAVVATMIGWAVLRFRGQTTAPFWSTGLLFGGLLSLVGVIPAAAMNLDGSGLSGVASMIYVYDRIPHHLLPANFYPIWYLRHGLLVAATVALISGRNPATGDDPNDNRWRRLRSIAIGALAIEAIGLSLGLLPHFAPELAASLLRFYWFRFSDAVLPLVLALAILRRWPTGRGVLWTVAGVSVFVVAATDRISGAVPVSVQNRLLGWQTEADAQTLRATWQDWRAVCRWAAESTPPETMFLTPRHQQTFKWYSGRPEVVNWKDVPQDAASLVQWKRRIAEVYPVALGNIKVTINYEKLRQFRRQYGAQYMIVDHRVVAGPLPLQKIYPLDPRNNATYAVYDLPR